MTSRIAPAQPPFSPAIQSSLDQLMRGAPPLTLFTTLARDERLFGKFFSASLLDKGRLSLRQRELVIDRITARGGSEYEWGVHIAIFAEKAGLTPAQIHATVHDEADAACWNEAERALLQACDALHDNCTLDAEQWQSLRAHYEDEAILEIIMLAGFYRTVSYLTNALALPLEAFAPRFPAK